MAKEEKIKALLFADVFGTVVDWRTSVRELQPFLTARHLVRSA